MHYQLSFLSVYLGGKPKNVILFGETGVGKSSVINLMAGKEIAEVSANLNGCTLTATEYWFGLSEDVSLRIFDTIGLEEPEIGINTFMGAMEKAHRLVRSLHYSGGIDLLLFCIRGGRITTAMQRNYRLFFEILCGSQVPVAIVITNLEQENVMEDWWVKNEKRFREYGIDPIAHACITAVPSRVTMYAQKRAQSQKALRDMLLDTLTNSKPAYMRDIRSWFSAIIQMLRSFLAKTESLKKKDLIKKLERRCMLPRSDAEKLAHILTGAE